MRTPAFLFVVFGAAFAAHADPVLDVPGNLCHLPTSRTIVSDEYYIGGCTPRVHVRNQTAWGYLWIEATNVARRIAPAYPAEDDYPSGELTLQSSAADLNVPCVITDGMGRRYESNDWHASTRIRRTRSRSWVSVRYSLYCYAGRIQ